MKSLPKRVISLALLLVAGIASPAQQTAGPHPDNGIVNDRRYINGYFGFSYRFPEGWNGSAAEHSLTEVGTGKEALFYSLFTANPVVSGVGDVRYIGIQADDISRNPSIRSGKDFLAASTAPLTGKNGAFEAGRSWKYTLGGRQFYRQDLKSKPVPGNQTFYQAQISTVARNLAVTFSFVAANMEDLEELVRTMESINFFEPGKVPVAPVPASATAIAKSAAQPADNGIFASVHVAPQPAASPGKLPVAPVSTPAQAPAAVAAAGNDARENQSVIVTAAAGEQEVQKPVVNQPQVAAVKPVVMVSIVAPRPVSAPRAPEVRPAAVVSARVDPLAESFVSPAPAMTPAKPAPSTLIQISSAPVQSFASPAVPVGSQSRPASSPQPHLATISYKPEPMSFAPAASILPETAPETTRAALPAVPAAGALAIPSRVRISSIAFQNYIAHKTVPPYPPMAKTGRVEGEVVLNVVVDRSGHLQNVTVVSGPILLRKGAEDAVKEWRFKPYDVDGQPVEMESQISMNFRLGQ